MPHYDSAFFNWYNNEYKKPDKPIVTKDTKLKEAFNQSANLRRRTKAALQKVTNLKKQLKDLQSLEYSHDMQILAKNLEHYKQYTKLTYKEIAAQAGVPLNAIATHIVGRMKKRSKYTMAIIKYLETRL